ncbi:MAG: vitamin B12 dependent-methionine synthase activation domain-containing protein, partial [Gammaproteobacteria bacterium]
QSLLIGGATTSQAHTAVKIEPQYEGAVVYVPDASRAVGVASSLLSDEHRAAYLDKVRAEYAAIRERRAGKDETRNLVPIAAARANPTPVDWDAYTPPVPARPGVHVLEVPVAELEPFIDWTFFFHAWQLKGRFPRILDDPEKGEEARKLYADVRAMLERVVAEGWLQARAVIGLFPANAVGDDIEVYADAERGEIRMVLHNLRKQGRQPAGKYNECLADFVAPRASGKLDWIGGFACTAGLGIEQRLQAFEADHDDYHAIMLKALADRLAEALAEWLHAQVRREYWGYAADEQLDNAALIEERYRGIRPAMGYPASPDHTEKDLLWELLDVEARTGIWLTESKAMVPTAAVSGLYFAHPASRYFAVGKIGRDQVADYAARKGMPLADVERWLAPNLAYDR